MCHHGIYPWSTITLDEEAFLSEVDGGKYEVGRIKKQANGKNEIENA